MPASPPANGMGTPRLPRSPRVLLLVDYINPLDFPGADKLAAAAVEAPATAALKQRLARDGVATIYANDNYGIWQTAESEQAKAASLTYMAGVLKCDTQPSGRTAPPRKTGKKNHA